MRDLLFLTHRIPYPPNKGDKIRAYHMLRYLQQYFRVHLGAFIDQQDDLRHAAAPELCACASNCLITLPVRRARCWSARALLTGEALSVAYYRHRAMQRWVRDTLAQHRITTALAFSGPMGQYLPPSTRHGPLLRVMDLVDVDSEKWRAYAQQQPWPMAPLYRREAQRLGAHERQIAEQFNHTVLVSPAEAALLRERAPAAAAHIDYVNMGVDSAYFSHDAADMAPHNPYARYPADPAIVFTGVLDYPPNVEAVAWFAAQVLPALRQHPRPASFHIVGARPCIQALALARLPGVYVHANVADVRPYLRHAALAVAPLWLARGVQSKVLEAMAMQKTVIATPAALEGISAIAGTEVLVAGDAQAFIAHAGRELDMPGRLGIAARQRVLRDYQWNTNLQRLGRLLGVEDVLSEQQP
ncbi:MAG: TIGR03087 family PEP-CTERM/XrtA system glycosyltransferase [Duganella sp.]